MLSINELKPGVVCKIEGAPHVVLEAHHSHIGRGGAVVETRIKNLKTGSVLTRSYKAADAFEEVDIERVPVIFLYGHRGEYWFHKESDPKSRFSLTGGLLEKNTITLLKQSLRCEALITEDGEILTISLPIKIDLHVAEAPPSIRGNTAQGGTKIVTLETGRELQVPLFIENGDVVRINTETGEYVERVEKAK